MAGNGGGTGFVEVADYIVDAHKLLLSGGTSEKRPWGKEDISGKDTTPIMYDSADNLLTYTENPSVLRFVLERGLTDVGGNPFDGVSSYDPEEDLEEVDEQYADLKESVDARVTETDVNGFITSALEKRSDILSSIDTESVFRDALDVSFASLNSKYSSTFEDAKIAVQAAINTIITRARASSDITSTSIEEVASRIAKALHSDILTEARIDAEGVIKDSVKGAQDADSLLSSAINSAYIGAQRFLDMAISSAKDAIASDVVESLVKEYRKQALKTHLRSVNRFAGSMADINAVQSSTFVIGMALKESEYTSDVNRFQAEFTSQLYMETLRTFSQVSNYLVGAYIQIFSQLLESRLTFLARQSTTDVGDILRTIIAARMQVYNIDHTGELGAINGQTDGRARTLSYALANQLEGSFQTKLTESSNSMRASFELINDYMNYDDKTLALDNSIMQLLTEYKRIKFVMKNEQYTRDLEYDSKSANWDMELFQKAGNVLSAYSGAVVPQAGQPSPAQSALGGALAGASIGAEFGPWGAAAGAGIGAVSSLLLNS